MSVEPREAGPVLGAEEFAVGGKAYYAATDAAEREFDRTAAVLPSVHAGIREYASLVASLVRDAEQRRAAPAGKAKVREEWAVRVGESSRMLAPGIWPRENRADAEVTHSAVTDSEVVHRTVVTYTTEWETP